MANQSRKHTRHAIKYEWDKEQIRALRIHLNMTQHEMADELEVRQQTISEWETGRHQPHRSTLKILSMLAENAEFAYTTLPKDQDAPPDNIDPAEQ